MASIRCKWDLTGIHLRSFRTGVAWPNFLVPLTMWAVKFCTPCSFRLYPANRGFLSGKCFSMYEVVHVSCILTTQNTRDVKDFVHAKTLARKKRLLAGYLVFHWYFQGLRLTFQLTSPVANAHVWFTSQNKFFTNQTCFLVILLSSCQPAVSVPFFQPQYWCERSSSY